jgi:peptidoglycan/xylan/chitin deacetylase (PgdA/CDA1 family)
MRSVLALCIALIATDALGQQSQMAITVDDLPVVVYGNDDPNLPREITGRLLATFERYDVPAIGFVNESNLYADGELDSSIVALLEQWVANGFELGNHTYSHLNYHEVPFEQFTADVLGGELVTRDLMESHDLDLRYFRHPYLRIGLRASHADSLTRFLHDHGYVTAPVTIDNTDYLFAREYGKADLHGDTELMARIGAAYVAYMEEKLIYFEGSAERLFGRNIPQILLVHASLLNADYLDDLIRVFIEHGYSFVSQSDVLEDAAYATAISRYGDWGISWIDRWALSQDVDSEFFSGDPRTPEWIPGVAN